MAEGGREAVWVDDEVGAARVRQLEERIRDLDAELLARIRPLVDARPSYGCPA